jgi:hypothetical protein
MYPCCVKQKQLQGQENYSQIASLIWHIIFDYIVYVLQ